MNDEFNVTPTIRHAGHSVIGGYKKSASDTSSIFLLVEEMLKLEDRITLHYNPRDGVFLVLIDADMEELVFQKLRMFAIGFLKALNITTTEER